MFLGVGFKCELQNKLTDSANSNTAFAISYLIVTPIVFFASIYFIICYIRKVEQICCKVSVNTIDLLFCILATISLSTVSSIIVQNNILVINAMVR